MKNIILIGIGIFAALYLTGNWGLEQKREKERMEQNLFNKTKEYTHT